MATSVVALPITEPETRVARLPFYYGWVNLVMASLAMTATLPGRTHGLGLITKPLLTDLQMDELRYGTLNFWAILLGAAFCLPAGRLLDRYGTRTVLTVVTLALGGVVVLMSGVTGWLALFGVLILIRGLGQGTLSVASMALVGKWFTRRLGPAMGIFSVLLAIGFIATTLGLGQAVIAFGWRPAWLVMGLVLMVGLAPLFWLLVRSTPEACGLTVEREPVGETQLAPRVDVTLRRALATPAFWVFSLATSLFGLIWSAITLFNQAILEEHGFDANMFYIVMALLTASGLVSNLLGGWLATRWPLGRLLGIAMLFFALCLVSFPGVSTTADVVLYALGLGVAGGLITVIHFVFYGQAFGRSHLGQIQGTAQVLSVFASALGPLILAASKDWTGSYDLMFFGSALVVAILGVCAWLVPLVRPNPQTVEQGSV